MNTYTSGDILRIAKRFNNQKRTYLLVNPLQAKHIPASPNESFRMMKTLGDLLANKYPNTRLVIGFAETATAIGAVVAECFSSDCIYIHTTRESVEEAAQWVYFSEEHSHATEQSLVGDNLSDWISATDSVVFVDDEISTGKTLINIIEQLKQRYPQLKQKQIVAASLLNRVSEDNEKKLNTIGVVSECLLKLPQSDYSSIVNEIPIHEAPLSIPEKVDLCHQRLTCQSFGNPRIGVQISNYKNSCLEMAKSFLVRLSNQIKNDASILVLGTEECMYPALILGKALEDMSAKYYVRCHATTRSPIGICEDEKYSITSGYKIKSFYDNKRSTYIYNLGEYDAVVVVTDTLIEDFNALESLVGAFPNNKSLQFFYIQCGKNVWYTKRKEK